MSAKLLASTVIAPVAVLLLILVSVAVPILDLSQFLPASIVFAAETKAQAALRQGDYYKDRGANKEAYEYYLQAVRLAPGDYRTHRRLADNLASQKKYAEAIKEVNLAIALNPNFAKLFVERGLYYFGLGKRASAQADFEKAVALPLCGHTVYKYLEDIYKSQGRLDQAIALCDLQIKREPNEATYSHKGECLMLKKDYVGAVQALTKAISYAPLNYLDYQLRGDAYLSAGLAKEAVSDYTKALSLEPFFPTEIYQHRARAYAKLGQKDLESKDIERSLAKD